VILAESSSGTWIFWKTSSFHSLTESLTVSFNFQDGISFSIYERALSVEIEEMPTREVMDEAGPFFQLKRTPMRLFIGPEATFLVSFP
jgi:hypothetical protein